MTLDELSIKVNIADRYYPLSVTAEQERLVRAAAKLIQDNLKLLDQQFSVKDKQDMLSMCALELATELVKQREEQEAENVSISAELKEVQELLKRITANEI